MTRPCILVTDGETRAVVAVARGLAEAGFAVCAAANARASLAAAHRSRAGAPLPPTDVGGRGVGWIAAAPDVFRLMPWRLRPVISFRRIRPAGASWLRPRLVFRAGCRAARGGPPAAADQLCVSATGSSRMIACSTASTARSMRSSTSARGSRKRPRT